MRNFGDEDEDEDEDGVKKVGLEREKKMKL